MQLRIFCTLICLVALSGCSYLDGHCGFELRSITSEGSAKLNPTDSADAHLLITERRGNGADIGFTWEVRGIKFRQRVISVKLVNRTGNVVFTFPPPQASLPTLSEGHVQQTQGVSLENFYDMLASAEARVVIEMSSEFMAPETGNTTLIVPMDRIKKSGWERPYCS